MVLMLLLASCKTREERARRLIDRANKLYPIEKLVDTVYRVDTVIVKDTVIVVKGDTVEVEVPVAVTDSITKQTTLVSYKDKLIVNDGKHKVYATANGKGNLSVKIECLERKVPVRVEVPFKVKIPGKVKYITKPAEKIYVKGLFWNVGLVASILLGLGALYGGYRLARKFKLVP